MFIITNLITENVLYIMTYSLSKEIDVVVVRNIIGFLNAGL